ncbi:globin [Gemmatirosa kalamazoonensis]|uniref:Globin n=1 Tax=Gemmatirosa kalamazoonensis TaxID=861299 RepID=W0RNE9_9BACT|nr:globin domain-containing protein [Gemmatirosa kalamazoonensis]AHG91850.1 globin [Gemmatirosa kalamazoonensis]
MTPEHAQLVRSTWPAVAADVDALASRFYRHLFELDGAAAGLFATVDMTAQRAKLARTLGVIVATLDDPDALLPVIGALGKRHVGYGVEQRHYDTVGDALLWALRDTLGTAFTPEVHDAWAEAYTLVASVMRRALVRTNDPAVS